MQSNIIIFLRDEKNKLVAFFLDIGSGLDIDSGFV